MGTKSSKSNPKTKLAAPKHQEDPLPIPDSMANGLYLEPKVSFTSFKRQSLLIIDNLEAQIEDNKHKIDECDQEIVRLSSSPINSIVKKRLTLAKVKREKLNRFVDNLIKKQYQVDKRLFETSVKIPDSCYSEPESEDSSNEKPKRHKSKSLIQFSGISEITTRLSQPFFEPNCEESPNKLPEILETLEIPEDGIKKANTTEFRIPWYLKGTPYDKS